MTVIFWPVALIEVLLYLVVGFFVRFKMPKIDTYGNWQLYSVFHGMSF